MYGIIGDAAIQILFVVAGTVALKWYWGERERARARRGQFIAKTLERLQSATTPLHSERISDGGAAARYIRQKLAAEEKIKLAAMVQMAERVAQGTATFSDPREPATWATRSAAFQGVSQSARSRFHSRP